jgi:hypothetical protein
VLEDDGLGNTELCDYISYGGAVKWIANEDELEELNKGSKISHLGLLLFCEQLLA